MDEFKVPETNCLTLDSQMVRSFESYFQKIICGGRRNEFFDEFGYLFHASEELEKRCSSPLKTNFNHAVIKFRQKKVFYNVSS